MAYPLPLMYACMHVYAYPYTYIYMLSFTQLPARDQPAVMQRRLQKSPPLQLRLGGECKTSLRGLAGWVGGDTGSGLCSLKKSGL